MPKPKLREIEMYVTTLRLAWPEFRTKYLELVPLLTGELGLHLKNIVLILEFFIPIVSVLF